MRLRESSSFLIYRLINIFSKKSHFEKFLEKKKVDLVYFISQSYLTNYVHNINYIFTLFDLCHRDNPEFPEVKNNRIFEFREKQLQNNLARAVAVLVESQLGKKNVIYRYRLDEERVHVFPIEPALTIEFVKSRSDKNIENRYIDIKKNII